MERTPVWLNNGQTDTLGSLLPIIRVTEIFNFSKAKAKIFFILS